MPRPILASAAAMLATVVLSPALAHAGNGTHQRTPVIFFGEKCMTIVDKTSDPLVHIDYTIPLEDTDVTADEVEDSRRHQFLAMCKHHDPQSHFPNWVSQADVDAALAKGLGPPGGVDGDDVLETNSEWQDCWHRINGDDERRTIECASVDDGIDWDVSDVPAGVYSISGYTWEPWPSIWRERRGVVKVVDGGDDTFPAAAVMNGPEQDAWEDTVVPIELCIDALDGSTLTASWSIAREPFEWVAFVEDEPVPCDSPAIMFTPPDHLDRPVSLLIRIDVTDPMGRTYTAYHNGLILALKGADPEADCDTGEGGSFIGAPNCDGAGDGGDGGSDPDADKPDACGVILGGGGEEPECIIVPGGSDTGGGSGSASGTPSGGSGTSGGATGPGSGGSGGSAGGTDGGKGGCACGVGSTNGLLAALMLPLGLLLVDRRRASR